MRRPWRAVPLSLMLVACASAVRASEAIEGYALLERSCGRCHALKVDARSPLKAAPNLWTVLRSYPSDRLEFELAEGIGSRHPAMPQVQFTSDDIFRIQAYLFDR